jgi:hypothetical protein
VLPTIPLLLMLGAAIPAAQSPLGHPGLRKRSAIRAHQLLGHSLAATRAICNRSSLFQYVLLSPYGTARIANRACSAWVASVM